mgnify:FL=1|tara:strand:- start:163 stop:1098 length:936 start_codon:yes stop_codon:yes gene_type:complete
MNLKKPKFWDYKKPNIYAYLLLPLTYLLKILNYLNLKFSKRNLKRTGIKTICIGNIYVGGTGKTSLSIKINEILNKQEIKSCFIKKFYKTQRDEQKLLNSRGKLFLSAKRRDAIYEAEKQNYKVAICDDGLQDKSIDYDLKFVCFNSINWIGNGMTLPSGPLRENINNLKNYEHVFINGNLENLEEIKKQIFKINPQINIYFGIYEPVNITEFKKNDKYIVFSGIGNHKTFVSMIQNYKLTILKDIEFPDHYKYNKKDINKILDYANQLNCKIITTEKDFLRLENVENEKIKYLKSELKILNEEKLLSLLV